MNHRVQDMPDQPHAETFDFFEVDEGGTLTLLGAEELTCHRQIFTDIEPDRLLSATDLIDAIEGTYPLQAHIERLFETELSARDAHPYICSVLSSSAPESVWPSNDESSSWQSWIEGLSTEGLVKVRGHIESWLDDDVDWAYVEYFPTSIGPQGEALSYFESVPSAELDVLGIHLVYGDHPGSSYYAAELRSDIEVANTRAAERGLSFRFLAQGCAFEPPPRSPLEVERELLAQRFRPAFGLLPDPVPGVHEQAPARVRRLPPAALLPAHDTVLVDEWWERAVRELSCPTAVWLDEAGVRHIRVVGGGDPTLGSRAAAPVAMPLPGGGSGSRGAGGRIACRCASPGADPGGTALAGPGLPCSPGGPCRADGNGATSEAPPGSLRTCRGGMPLAGTP